MCFNAHFSVQDSRIKRTDSVAMLRHRRRIAANDERRVCIDRCAEVAATAAPSSPLLYYLMRLRSCCDAQREILAFLIYQKLPTSLSKAAIDEMHARGLIPIIVQCLIVNDLLRRCACRIIAQIIVHDNAMHINELNRCHFGLKIVSLIDIDDNEVFDYVCTIISSIIHKENATNPTFRLELLVQLVNAYARTLKTKIGDLINDIIRVMVDRSEFNGAWSEAILPLMYNLVTAPIQTDQVREKNLSFLSSLTEGFGFHERTDKIVQYRFVPMLIQLISGPVTIQLTTLKVIKNISKSYDEHIFDLLNANLLVPLKEILQKGSAKISRHLTLDILSNISGGHRTEVVAIINAGFVPLVLDVMLNSDRTSQLFATWIINNLTNRGGIDEIQSLIACGALDVLCKMLPIPDNDIIIVRRILFLAVLILLHGPRQFVFFFFC